MGERSKEDVVSVIARHRPLLARRQTMAELLDVSVRKFDDLRQRGIVPAPIDMGGVQVWDVDEVLRQVRESRREEAEAW